MSKYNYRIVKVETLNNLWYKIQFRWGFLRWFDYGLPRPRGGTDAFHYSTESEAREEIAKLIFKRKEEVIEY